MGLETIGPHSHKVQTKLYKIPKFGVNRPKRKQDTAIWKCHNLQRNPDAVQHSIRMPYMLILMFLNPCISVNTKLENLMNLNVLFLTMWINSCYNLQTRT